MILDIAVIVFAVVMCIIGAKKGILKMLLRICSWALSTVLAWLFFTPVAELLKNTPIAEHIQSAVLTGFVEPRIEEAQSAVPEIFRGMFEVGADSGADAIAAGISGVVISVLAFILTLILCRILLMILGSLVNLMSRLPLVKQCNKLLGGVLGALEGLLILYIAAAIIFVSAPLCGSGFFEKQMSQSVIASEIYNNNFITKLIYPTSLDEGEANKEKTSRSEEINFYVI